MKQPLRISRVEVIPPGTWRTQDGRLIPFRELERGHLLNIIAMLERYAEAWKLKEELGAITATSMLRGEGALDAAESDINRLSNMSVEEYLCSRNPDYVELRREAARRGLLEFDEGDFCTEDPLAELGLRWV